MKIDSKEFRNACGRFATGVTVITTRDEEGDHGMTANAFMSISLDPPLIAVSIGNKSRMMGKVKKVQKFAVSILPENTEDIAMHFAGKTDESLTDVISEIDGFPVIKIATTQFIANVYNEVPGGDHTIFIGEVTNIIQNEKEASSLLFYSGKFTKIP